VDVPDTLTMPRDTAYFACAIHVRDSSGRPIAGVAVDLTLALQKGWIEFTQPGLQNRTDPFGNMIFVYAAAGSGTDTLVAVNGDQRITRLIHLLPGRDNVGSLDIQIAPDTLTGMINGDSIQVAILVRDSANVPVSNFTPFVWVSGGELSALAPSGQPGIVRLLWYPSAVSVQYIHAIGSGKRTDAVLHVLGTRPQ
jgi:hypothetical protein